MLRQAVTVLIACLLLAAPALAEPIEILTRPLLLDPADPDVAKVDGLIFRGGLELSSPSKNFGGLSGLLVSPDGAFMDAVADNGHRFRARLHYDEKDDLVALSETELSPLLGTDGRPLDGRRNLDAESMARAEDGGVVVAFERRHRLWHYPPDWSRPRELPPPRELPLAPSNDGVEALTRLKDGRLLALTEGFFTQGGVIGWVGDGTGWSMVTYETDGIFRPTGAATLASGDVLILERRFSLLDGTSARVKRVGATAFVPGARFRGEHVATIRPPLTVDNMEGIDIRQGKRGETLVYLLSDDNFRRDQRTLLMMFELAEE